LSRFVRAARNQLAAFAFRAPSFNFGPFSCSRNQGRATALLSMFEEFTDLVLKADEERQEQALKLALCELLPDLIRVPDDQKAYARWCKRVDLKAFEIFNRLN
jgi:hypothetical protein